MAAPVDSARQGTNITTAATSHAINVGSPVAGTLLIVHVRFAGAPGTVTFTGYTEFASSAADAADDDSRLYWRWADGTEGATDTLTTVNSVKLSATSWEVTGAHNEQPGVSTVATGTTTANTANPTAASVPGGPQDALYLAIAGGDGEVGAYTGTPTNYVNLTVANSGTGGAAASNNFIGGASRQITASSSDDPGAFTHGAHTSGWMAWTVAISAPRAISETPTPGGGLAGGTAPAPGIGTTIAGALAAGSAPAPGSATVIGGAAAAGVTASALIPTSIGGAVAGGVAPGESSGVFETPTPGGAAAGGVAPSPQITASIGGASAGGNAPAASVVASIGGSLAAGNALASTSSLSAGGGIAAGSTPSIWVTSTIGGGVATGFAPSENIGGGGTSETPTPGGALAGGRTPAAFAVTPAGGATSSGTSPNAAVQFTAGGGLTGGNGPTANVTSAAGGAVASGRAPTIFLPGAAIYTQPFDESGPAGVVTGTPGAARFDLPEPIGEVG